MRAPIALLLLSVSALAFPAPKPGDFVIKDFRFSTGETIPELRQHYRTVGELNGNNAVLIMHGTTGSGDAFTRAGFGGQLFEKGQLLDATAFFIILPDGLGHGASSRPSDGMHAKFPSYTYTDMVEAQYRLVTEGLGVKHLRLVMGTSMGAMHTWLWGEKWPDFMDALMPLASAPVQIAGRNRMMRRMVSDAIRNDPEWMGGEYTAPPRGLDAALYVLWFMTTAPIQQHKDGPTRDAADQVIESYLARQRKALDANDMLYAYEASRDYDPSPDLEKIQAPLFAINSADDEVNPPELGILEREIKRVKKGRYILLPIGAGTRGHGTHSMPAIWKNYLEELLAIR